MHIIRTCFTVFDVFSFYSRFLGDSHALHASRLSGESPEVHRQGSYATRETKKWVTQLVAVICCYLIAKNDIMWNCKKKEKEEHMPCVPLFFNLISTFQCWTAAPSSLPFKSFYWSTSSCVGSSRATRPLHYRRYIAPVSMVISFSFIVFDILHLIVQ